MICQAVCVCEKGIEIDTGVDDSTATESAIRSPARCGTPKLDKRDFAKPNRVSVCATNHTWKAFYFSPPFSPHLFAAGSTTGGRYTGKGTPACHAIDDTGVLYVFEMGSTLSNAVSLSGLPWSGRRVLPPIIYVCSIF